MDGVTSGHIAGAVITLLGISAAGVYSGKKVKKAADFATGGGKAGQVIVAGTVLGTLIGGSSTIGAAQLASRFGLSALWFFLGLSLGCLILGLGFTGPLRRSGCQTIQQIIGREYGPKAELLSSILSSLGTLIAVVAQLLSATALLTAFLGLPSLVCALIAVAIMVCYVVFGGLWGAGLVGGLKTILVYLAVIVSGWIILTRSGGLAALYEGLDPARYQNLFARGVGVDAVGVVSLILGILSTQTYVQAIIAGKDEKTARRGVLLGALLLPPVGAGGILIGVFMARFPLADSSQAFPSFLLQYTPPFIGGVFLAVLLIAIVGTGSGLALGISTILSNLYKMALAGKNRGKSVNELWLARGLILAVLLLALLFTLGDMGSFILQWSVMSMALRAATSFIPLCGALFFRGRLPSGYVIAAIVAGPCVVLAGELFYASVIDPVLFGLFVSAMICCVGALVKKLRHS
jgi:SSS family solute:Na+ symporter